MVAVVAISMTFAVGETICLSHIGTCPEESHRPHEYCCPELDRLVAPTFCVSISNRVWDLSGFRARTS
jgi:hypothetical protein